MFGGARAQRARMVAETVDFGEDVFASVKGPRLSLFGERRPHKSRAAEQILRCS